MYVDEIITFFYFELRLCVCLIYEFSCVHEIQYIESSVVSLIRSLPFLSLLTFV